MAANDQEEILQDEDNHPADESEYVFEFAALRDDLAVAGAAAEFLDDHGVLVIAGAVGTDELAAMTNDLVRAHLDFVRRPDTDHLVERTEEFLHRGRADWALLDMHAWSTGVNTCTNKYKKDGYSVGSKVPVRPPCVADLPTREGGSVRAVFDLAAKTSETQILRRNELSAVIARLAPQDSEYARAPLPVSINASTSAGMFENIGAVGAALGLPGCEHGQTKSRKAFSARADHTQGGIHAELLVYSGVGGIVRGRRSASLPATLYAVASSHPERAAGVANGFKVHLRRPGDILVWLPGAVHGVAASKPGGKSLPRDAPIIAVPLSVGPASGAEAALYRLEAAGFVPNTEVTKKEVTNPGLYLGQHREIGSKAYLYYYLNDLPAIFEREVEAAGGEVYQPEE